MLNRPPSNQDHRNTYQSTNSALDFNTEALSMRTQSLTENQNPNHSFMPRTASNDAPKELKCQWKYWWPRIAILTAIILIAVLAIIFSDQVSQVLSSFLDWVRTHKLLGPLLLALVYILATVCFIPGSILTLGAGWAFQQAYQSTLTAVVIGTIAVFIGAWIGSVLAFILGRYVFR